MDWREDQDPTLAESVFLLLNPSLSATRFGSGMAIRPTWSLRYEPQIRSGDSSGRSPQPLRTLNRKSS